MLSLSTVRLWGFKLFHCHLCARSSKNFEIRQAASSNKLISAKDTRTSNIHASRETMRTRVQDEPGENFSLFLLVSRDALISHVLWSFAVIHC